MIRYPWRHGIAAALRAGVIFGATLLCLHARAADGEIPYHPIDASMADTMITLTGHDMSIEQVIQVARYGAKVQLSREAKQRESDNYGLLLEAPAEGVAVYWFNRGSGAGREVSIFEGDPLDPNNKMKDGTSVKEYLEKKELAFFQQGVASAGDPPEIAVEELVRAVMVVRANAMTYDAPSPQLAQMLIDMLNKRVTPVMMSRGSTGESDMAQTEEIAGPMVGVGESYYQGVRMPSAQALQRAGLKPIQPFAADENALTSSNAYSTAMAVFIVADAKQALEWADLTYAIDLNGMNSSLTPLSYLVQTNRPFKWLNWEAGRVKEMLKGSYLFGADPGRIIQDPESLRAVAIRQGSAWQMWATLKDDVVTQLNSSDHNPAIRAGLSPQESWDLQTPEMMKYYVKGGKNSHGMHGFILSNANWDPYPIANDLEAFTISLANMDIVVMLRIKKFASTFFTQINPQDVLKDPLGDFDQGGDFSSGSGGGYVLHDAWQDIQAQLVPVAPEGYGDTLNVEDLEGQTRIKAQRAMAALDGTFRLLADDLINGARWLDVRKIQDPSRNFGSGPTAAWQAFRKVVPLHRNSGAAPGQSTASGAFHFLKTNSAASFVPMEETLMPVEAIQKALSKSSVKPSQH